jgi:hypothetical protein
MTDTRKVAEGTTMTSTPTSTLVFKDATGNHLLVPREALEQGRVPEVHKSEIERLIADKDDVSGFVGIAGEVLVGWTLDAIAGPKGSVLVVDVVRSKLRKAIADSGRRPPS